MDSYDLLQKRLNARGTSVEHRIANDKLKTLEKALLYSYQAETVIKLGSEDQARALINNNKLKMDYDDKIISIPYREDFQVGTIFFWPRVNENWIVYLRQYSEDAYFRGFIRKANNKIRWKDEYGVMREVLGAVRGPVETKIKGEMKSGNAFDIPNYTLSIIVPNTEYTSSLKRYSKVAVQNKMWEVTVADDISEPGVIDLQLVEYYIDREKDIDTITGVMPMDKSSALEGIKIRTSLDSVKELELYEPFKLWTIVEKNGSQSQELIEDAKFSVVSGSAVLTENFLNVLEPPGLITLKLKIPKIGYEKEFTFEAKALSLPPATEYLIVGDENTKSFGKTKYTAKYFMDGMETTVENGVWEVVPNPKLFSIASQDSEHIEFKWVVGMHGKLTINFRVNNDIVATKDVVVQSLI